MNGEFNEIQNKMAKYYAPTRFRPECPTCGNKLGQLEESYKRLLEQGKTPADALDSLGVERLCCRVRALWPIVLPYGGFYLPGAEVAMQQYLGIKEAPPKPTLVVVSLRKAASGERFLVSHVNAEGFIGQYAKESHEPTEVIIQGNSGAKRDTDISIFSAGQLSRECEIRIQTEPGEISRTLPFQVRSFSQDINVNRVKSYFDIPPETETLPEDNPQENVYSAPVNLPKLTAVEDFSDEESIA